MKSRNDVDDEFIINRKNSSHHVCKVNMRQLQLRQNGKQNIQSGTFLSILWKYIGIMHKCVLYVNTYYGLRSCDFVSVHYLYVCTNLRLLLVWKRSNT